MSRNRHRAPAPTEAPAEQEAPDNTDLEEPTVVDGDSAEEASAPTEAPAEQESADGESTDEPGSAVGESQARPGFVRCRVNTALRYDEHRFEAGDVAEFPEHIADSCPALDIVEG